MPCCTRSPRPPPLWSAPPRYRSGSWTKPRSAWSCAAGRAPPSGATIRCASAASARVSWAGSATHRQPINVPDVTAHEGLARPRWWPAHGLRSFYGLPIRFEDRLLAVLALYGREPFQFAPDDQALLESFGAQAAVAIRNASLYGAVGAAR